MHNMAAPCTPITFALCSHTFDFGSKGERQHRSTADHDAPRASRARARTRDADDKQVFGNVHILQCLRHLIYGLPPVCRVQCARTHGAASAAGAESANCTAHDGSDYVRLLVGVC